MPLPVLRSKLTSERIRVEFDFSSDLQFGETISDPVVLVEVATGEDPSPEDMIATRKFVDNSKIFQWIIGGLPGVIYNLICTVQGSSGRPYKLEKRLAVLPAVNLRPPLFGVSYSTTPYAVEFEDSMRQSGEALSGYTFGIILEEFSNTGLVLSGQLRTPLQNYAGPPELMSNLGVVLSGELRTPLKTYTSPPENISNLGVPINGTIKVVLITYSNWPAENMSNNGAILSGTFT